MRAFLSGRRRRNLFIATCTWLVTPISAINLLEAKSLNTCMKNSQFTASYLNAVFTPNNGSLSLSIKGDSGVSGNVVFEAELLAYGYSAYRKFINPCQEQKSLGGFCPMRPSPFELPFNTELPDDQIKRVPNAVYYIPDLDAKVRLRIRSDTDGHQLACVEADLSNGRTVHQEAVAWIVAVITFLGFSLSGFTSGLGHTNAAAHLLSNSLSLFSYYQSLAFIGLTSVSTAPIVRAWSQNFQWSVGIMHLGFLHRMATWYQRATSGIPTILLYRLNQMSVHVEKRSLVPRTNTASKRVELKSFIVSGIKRVGFQAQIEESNIFFTTYTFFIIFILFTVAIMLLVKLICNGLVRYKVVSEDKFLGIRKEWKVFLKGNLFLSLLIAFPPMITFSLWELAQRDSSAEVVLAIATLLTLLALTAFAGFRICRLSYRSIQLHTNPAYILYSNPEILQHWGAFYIPFRAPWYFFGFILLGFTFVKACFVAFAQTSGTTQAIAILILDSVKLLVVALIGPCMDRKTNAFNISIAAVGCVNTIMLVLFTRDLGLPPLGISILGVLFFATNVVFLIFLLALVLINIAWALLSTNPDQRCAVRDDRNSFIRSKNSLPNPELDDLGFSARQAKRESEDVPEVPKLAGIDERPNTAGGILS